MIILSPNPGSVITRLLAPIINPYGNTLSMNTTWMFFSPEPHTSHIKYELLKNNEDEDSGVSTSGVESSDTEYDPEEDIYYWPPKDRTKYSRESYNRRLATGMYFSSTRENMEKLLAPWLCRRHPKADGVSVTVVTTRIESIEKANLTGMTLGDLTHTYESSALDFECPGKLEEKL